MKRKLISLLLALTLILWLLGTVIPAVTNEASAQGAAGEEVLDLPTIELPVKGNPKLDSQLNQLVGAEKRGELTAFARQTNIELFNGDVRVIIECLPGQLETASAAAVGAGAKLEMSYSNMLQAKVPVASLSALAEDTIGISAVSLGGWMAGRLSDSPAPEIVKSAPESIAALTESA